MTTHKRIHHPLLAQGRAAPLNGAVNADECLKLDYPSAPHVAASTAPIELACPYCGRHAVDAWPLRVALLLAVAVLGVVAGAWL
jgi:hypothetical protein